MLGLSTPSTVRLAEYVYGHAHLGQQLGPSDRLAASDNKTLLRHLRRLLLDSYRDHGLDSADAVNRLTEIRERVKCHHVSGWGVRAWLEIPDRQGVRIIVRDQLGRILMQRRTDDAPTNPGKWTAPGGRMTPGEDPHTAACRELAEETGLQPASLAPLGDLYFTAHHDDGAWVLHHLYTTLTTATDNDLRLGEGKALRFIDWNELTQLDISPSARKALALAWLTDH